MKGPQMERTTRRWSSKNEGSQMEGTANGEQEDKIGGGAAVELWWTSDGGGWRAAGGRELGFLVGEIG